MIDGEFYNYGRPCSHPPNPPLCYEFRFEPDPEPVPDPGLVKRALDALKRCKLPALKPAPSPKTSER